ncbi:MAG TPA: ThiF family adenylyltransferase [Gemmatimonadota bacterium]|nr:ThiF family adenylyltransferase [Gemmatimonadota bacterium]
MWGSDALLDSLEAPRVVTLRVPVSIFDAVRRHVEDFSEGEQAGFLICGRASSRTGSILFAREWMPVPQDEIQRDKRGFMLAWPASFNARVIDRADELNACAVLVHSHGDSIKPRLSGPDTRNAKSLFSPVSRLLPGRPCGSVVIGDGAASGVFWVGGAPVANLRALHVVGAPIEKWQPEPLPLTSVRRRIDRQTRAIGSRSDALLADSTIAVIGLSGGGSHVCQQLAHQGLGHLIGVDDQLVEEVQLGRMVGAYTTDIDTTFKTAAMRRLAESIDPGIVFEEIRERFPASRVRQALLDADLVIACVDSFLAREEINAFCRRHHLPLIDIGMNIETDGDGSLLSAAGQIVVVVPDSPCLRCGPLLSDAVLERERQERPPGYDLNPDAVGDPQIVSMNGVLASEAVNCALDLITGYANGARGAAWWLYDGRMGSLERCKHPSRRAGCPACAEQGHGEPTFL